MSNKTKKNKQKIDKRYRVKDEDIKQLELENMIIIRLSSQAIKYLSRIAKFGIYGKTVEEVAERFVDTQLENFVDREDISIKL